MIQGEDDGAKGEAAMWGDPAHGAVLGCGTKVLIIINMQMQETQVQSQGPEDLLEKGMAIHSSILAWRIPMDGATWWTTVHRVDKGPETP